MRPFPAVLRAVDGPWRRLKEHARAPTTIPTDLPGQVLWGLAQPFLGLTRLREPHLFRAALLPAVLMLLCCLLVAILGADEDRVTSMLRSFYRTIAILAPVPSVILVNHYARLAALAHEDLGFGKRAPRLQSLWTAIGLALRMAVVVSVSIAPLLGVLDRVPAVGRIAVGGLAALWSLYWIVVEALDSARTSPDAGADPGAQAPPEAAPPQPWFVRLHHAPAAHVPVVGGLLARFARFIGWLCRPWQEEIALCERRPLLFLGFSLTTAALLAVPVLNLFFRPVVLIAAVHVLGQLRREAGAAPD